MSERLVRNGLQIDSQLVSFVEEQAIPGTGLDAEKFWSGFTDLVHDLGPKNRALLEKREDLQAKIDAWHVANRGKPHDHQAYKAFLSDIGYMVPEGGEFTIDTANVDPEIAEVAGPQLVVPVTNARYALNAA
ncbi:MAG: malate synthase G, partial [Paracoccaceae bacterium]|nr:malate synthase G [Paracoccaceae bacterium]